MAEGEQRAKREYGGIPIASRLEIADAMSSYDSDRIAVALTNAVQATLSPSIVLGFLVEPDGEVDLRQILVDPGWEPCMGEVSDFSWIEPLLAQGAKNGASLVGPSLHGPSPGRGASQLVAVMDLGDERIAYFLIVGHYPDPDQACRRLARIAGEAGGAAQMIARSNERAADLAAIRERERLSRDLHDSLSQSLWSLSMLSETAGSMTDPDDPLHAVIRRIAEISLSSQEEMRSLLINLRTAEPSRETIAGVLEELVADFRSANNVEVVSSIAEADLDAPTVMALRRIAEEALNNVSRHANAQTLAVLFDVEPVLSLRIADDGVGFDARPVKGHLGLRVMRERAEELDLEFDVASSPGFGTVVTAAADLAAARPRPWSRPPRDVPSRRSAAAFLVAAAVFASMVIGSLFLSASYQGDIDQAQADLDVLTVLEQRVRVSRASANEATARTLENVGAATQAEVNEAMADRSVVIAQARLVAEPLTNMETLTGQYSLLFLDALEGASMTVSADQRLERLYAEVDRMEGPSGNPSRDNASPIHSLGNLAALNRTLTFSLLEMVVATYDMAPASYDPSEPARQFFEDYSSAVQGQLGFLGPDESMPFRNGVVPTSVASVHERAAVEELSQMVVDAELWADDEWLRRWSPDGPPAPTSLDNYVERFRQVTMEGRELVDRRFDARSVEMSEARDVGLDRQRVFRLIAGLLLLPALMCLVCWLRAARRRQAVMRIDRTIDPLTGLGNRKALDTEVAPKLQQSALTHHALITLDMDRLAIVNDVHGRCFGDRMLEVLSLGLQGLARQTPNVEGAAIRIGDDEFLVSLHSADPIPASMTYQAMNRLRSTLLSAPDGTLVRCSFSYGVVTAEGRPRLQSLMDACDLAMYEDKARLEVG